MFADIGLTDMNAPSSRDNPLITTLRLGALLVTIAHAVKTAQDPLLHYEVFWDGYNYNRQDSMGTRGTVTFHQQYVVGAFCDTNSSRYRQQRASSTSWKPLFQGAPDQVIEIAESSTTRYMLEQVGEAVYPVVTAAFWNVGEFIAGFEAWDVIVENGAHILRIEAMDLPLAKLEVASDYDLSEEQQAVFDYLLSHRVSSASVNAVDESVNRYFAKATGEGYVLSTELLSSIGIQVVR